MSYSDGLDWLARNVHEWPAGHQGWCFVTTHASGAKGVATHKLMHPEAIEVTIDQWLARRAELQNKPNWADFRESVKFMVQDSDGAWRGFENEPAAQSHIWNAKHGWRGYVSEGLAKCCGEVLGDWRDTLEKRPDINKNSDKIDASAERVQKKPESVRNWHESGELPPVGVFVDVTGDVAYGEGEKGCEVIAHVEDCAVIRMSWGLGCFVSRALSPHRTERDELVDIIASNGFLGRDGEACYLIADAIISAGFERKGGKS